MSQKNETKILALTLLLTTGIVGGSVWWFTNNGIKISNSITQNSVQLVKIVPSSRSRTGYDFEPVR